MWGTHGNVIQKCRALKSVLKSETKSLRNRDHILVLWEQETLSVHTCDTTKGFFRELYTSGLGSSHEMNYCGLCASDVAVPGL